MCCISAPHKNKPFSREYMVGKRELIINYVTPIDEVETMISFRKDAEVIYSAMRIVKYKNITGFLFWNVLYLPYGNIFEDEIIKIINQEKINAKKTDAIFFMDEYDTAGFFTFLLRE